MRERIEAICDLLLACAHADSEFADSEKDTIRKILCMVQRTDELEPWLTARILFTNPEEIDVYAAAAVFENDSEDKRRLLMGLVAAVNEADGEYAIEEDEMTIVIAGALGFNTDEIQEFTLNVEEESFHEDLEILTGERPAPDLG